MADDALALIAQSYAGIHDSTRVLAQTQRLALRIQGLALVLLGLALCGIGFLVWQHRQTSVELHRAIHQGNTETRFALQAVMRNTQTIAAQTQALLERQGQP